MPFWSVRCANLFALEGVCAPALEQVPGTAPDLDSVLGAVLGAEAVLVGVVPSVVSAAVTRPARLPDDGATLLAEVPGTTLCAEGAAASA